MKAGAAVRGHGDTGTCTRASKRGHRGAWGVSPPANGAGGLLQGTGRGVPMRGASRGFVPREPRGGHAGGGGQLGPHTPLSGCRAPVQAVPFSWGRVMAELSSWLVSHHQTHQRLRGALRKGVHPSGSLAAPSSQVQPCAQGSSEPQGLCEGMPRPRAEAFSEGEQQNPAAC